MRTMGAVGALVLIRAVVWLGIQMADADFRDALGQQPPREASYILVEPQQTWEPLVMCPAGLGCI